METEIAQGDGIVERLNRLKETPLDKINTEDAAEAIKRLMLRHELDTDAVAVARFGSYI